jgi:hypothetical protein
MYDTAQIQFCFADIFSVGLNGDAG